MLPKMSRQSKKPSIKDLLIRNSKYYSIVSSTKLSQLNISYNYK